MPDMPTIADKQDEFLRDLWAELGSWNDNRGEHVPCFLDFPMSISALEAISDNELQICQEQLTQFISEIGSIRCIYCGSRCLRSGTFDCCDQQLED